MCTDPIPGSIPKSDQNIHLLLNYNFIERFIKRCGNNLWFIQNIQQSVFEIWS